MMLITKYTSLLVQSSKKTTMVSPTYFRSDVASNSAAAFLPATEEPDEEDEEICCSQRDDGSGDAFLEPYMQGLAGDFGNAAFTQEVFEEEVSITTTSVTAGEVHRTSRIPSSDLFLRPSHEKNDSVRTSGRRSGSRRRLETPTSATYDPDENIEDQIVPLLSSPIGVDLPETPTADSVDGVHNRFKLVQVNTRERVAGTTGGSQASLNQLTSGDECSSGSSNTTNSSLEEEETPCNITLLERLIRTHPIWFLPGIQRAGAFHLLQGKEDGNFVVRQSSQNSTMAISVRLPNGKGPYIEHYLIQGTADGQIGLESSDNKFSSIPLLIAHYCQCCDELPVQLTLPRAIREAKNRQQLSSLALLGQEFWRYPMANPRPSLKGNEDPSAVITVISPSKEDVSVNSDSMPSSSSNSPASSLSSFDSASGGNNNVVSSGSMTGPSPVLELENCNSLSISESSVQPSSLMTTFKGSPPFGNKTPHNQIGIPVCSEGLTSLPVEASHNSAVLSTTSCFNVRKPRPTPPNTLNLISDVSTSPTSTAAPASWCSNNNSNFAVASSATSATTPPTNKTPPPPPPRWAKPVAVGTAVSSNVNSGNNVGTPSNSTTVVGQQNFTVTTTLTFSVNNKESSPPPQVQVSCIQISSPIPEKEESRSVSITQIQNTSVGSSAPLSLTQIPQTAQITPSSATSPLIQSSNSSQILSPVSEGNTRPFHKRNRRHRVSRHYQESDILESSVTYHRSTVADKVSDYEDIWGPDSSLSTFKPNASTPKTPFTPLEEFPVKSLKTDLPSTDVSEQRMSSSSVVTSPTESSAVNRNRFGLVLNTGAISSNSVVPISVANSADVKSPTESVKSPVELKQPSPFYAEPADAIKHQNALLRKKPRSSPTGQQASNNRHSDPTLFHQWPQLTSGCNSNLERIDSKEELITNSGLSSSMDNLISLRNSRRFTGGPLNLLAKSPKPVEPPKIAPVKKQYTDNIWPVDSSWEFIGKDVDDLRLGFDAESACRISSPQSENKPVILSFSRRGLTVQERISERLPKLALSPVYIKINNTSTSTNESNENAEKVFSEANCRLSISENVFEFSEKSCHNGLSVLSQFSDNSDDAQTEFSEPWDSSNWEHLLPKFENSEPSPNTSARVSSSKSFKERLDPLLSPPRLKALARVRAAAGTGSSPGASVRAYALQLAADKSTVFAQSIDNFIACTIDSKETRPQVVMRNIRQFMSGMKNYLLKHGEGEFEKEVEKERSKLKANEFMNLDAILEGVMHKLILLPLKDHLYNLFVDHYTENGAIQQLADSILLARTTPAQDLGLRDKIIPPKQSDLLKIFECFNNLQIADSPLEKLEHLLSAIAAIFHSVKVLNKGSEVTFLGADDFLPLFVWVLVQSGMVAAEIEAEYMWGLLHPSLLSGEGGYYLTTLSSAVNVLKNFKECSNRDQNPTISWCNDSLNEFRSVLKVVVPDEMNGSLLTKTLPVRPNMTTRDICKIIALKLRITNPQDYSLFKLVEGEETLLNEMDSPQDIKGAVTAAGKHCIFAYKRIDAKIAWPTSPTQE